MSENLLVKDVMSKAVTIAKSAAITEALDKMLDEGTDPLIVKNNGTVMGTISRKAIAETLGSKRNSNLSPTKIHVVNKTDGDYTSAYPDQEAEVLIPLLQEYRVVVVLDEEHHLFPAIIALDPELKNPPSIEIVQLINRMIKEHVESDALWATLDTMLADKSEDFAALEELSQQFKASMHEHAQIENEQIFPYAKTHISDRDFKKMGLAIAKRRGITPFNIS